MTTAPAGEASASPDSLKPGDEFPLWQFGGIITRGRTSEEAASHLSEPGRFQNALDMRSAKWYGRSHDLGWLTRPMYWLCEELGLDPVEYGHPTKEQRAARRFEELAASAMLIGALGPLGGSNSEKLD